MKRLSALPPLQTLFTSSQSLATASAALASATATAKAAFDKTPATPATRLPALATIASAFTEYDSQLATTWNAVPPPLRDAPANHQGAELNLLGQLLSRLHNSEAQPARLLLSLLTASPISPASTNLIRDLSETTARLATLAKLTEESAYLTLASEEIDVVTELALVLATERQRILDRSLTCTSPEDWTKLKVRLQAVISVSKNIESILESLHNHGPFGVAVGKQARAIQDHIITDRQHIETALAASLNEKTFVAAIKTYAQAMPNCLRLLFDAKTLVANQAITSKTRTATIAT
ncbi:MAG: hypothetical protein NTX04_07340, partial [Verrucomicrobia bacterium]|nr:hypothetical protein [Verrucomicrobiota bacterium]